MILSHVPANENDLWMNRPNSFEVKVYCYACMVWQGFIAIEGPWVYCHCNVAPKRSHYLLKRAIIQFLILPIWTGDTIKESCVKSLIVARPYNAARTLFYRGATSLYICMWSHMLPGGSDRGGQGGLEALPPPIFHNNEIKSVLILCTIKFCVSSSWQCPRTSAPTAAHLKVLVSL